MATNAPEVFSVLNPAGEVIFGGKVCKDNGTGNISYALEPSCATTVFRETAQNGLLVSCGGENKFIRLLELLAYARQEDLRINYDSSAKATLIGWDNHPRPVGANPRPFYVWGETKKVIVGLYCRVEQANMFWADSAALKFIFRQTKLNSSYVYLGNTTELHDFLEVLARARDYHETSLFVEGQKLRQNGGVEPIWKKVFTVKRSR